MKKENLRRCYITTAPKQNGPHISNPMIAHFHQWATEAYVVGESALIGGHSSGQVQYTRGIVEHTDGTIERVEPERIKFID